MNNLPALINTPPSLPATNNQLNPIGAAQEAMPQMHSPDGSDAQTRGEKRPRTDETEVDAESSTEPQLKLRRTESASDVASAKETKPPEKSLSDACKEGDLEMVKAWCERGADLMAADETGHSPLTWVCLNGHANIFTYLQEFKQEAFTALINPHTQINLKLLALASDKGHLPIVQLFVKAGVTKNMLEAALYRAILSSKEEIVDYLLKIPAMKGAAFLSNVDKDGNTMLMYCCLRGSLSAAQLLVRAGANLHATNNEGHTVVHLASISGKADILSFLLGLPGMSSPELLNQPDKKGELPIYHACRNGHLSIVKLLVEHGAQLNDCYSSKTSFIFQTPMLGGVQTNTLTEFNYKSNILDLALNFKKYGVAAYLIEKGLTAAITTSLPAIPIASPTAPEGIDVLNHTALLTEPNTAPAHGLAPIQPSLGQPQWLTQLVNYQFAIQPVAQGWKSWLEAQGVSAFIINELASLTTFLPVLSQAMAGNGKQPTQAQQLQIVASLVLRVTELLDKHTPFTGKGFSAEVEARFNTMFSQQLELLRQSAQAVLTTSIESHLTKLLTLGTDCLSINGTINHQALNHLLTQTIGLVGPNAARIVSAFEEAVQRARQQGAILDHLPAAFKECLQNKQDERNAPPEFVDGVAKMPDEKSGAYFSEVVFGQWRAICLAQNVQVPPAMTYLH